MLESRRTSDEEIGKTAADSTFDKETWQQPGCTLQKLELIIRQRQGRHVEMAQRAPQLAGSYHQRNAVIRDDHALIRMAFEPWVSRRVVCS